MSLQYSLFLSVIFLAIGAAAHLLVCRLTKGARFVAKGLLTGLIPLAAAGSYQAAARAFDPVLTYLVAAFWLTYLIFFINLLNSVTLKMLERLAAAPGGAMTAAAFEAAFPVEGSIAPRLEAMKRNNFLRGEPGAYKLSPCAALLLAAVRLIRKILSIDHVG